MSATTLLLQCRLAGVTVEVAGDKLKLQAEAAPPQALLDALRNHKAELLELLSTTPARAGCRLDPVMLEDLVERAAIIAESLPDDADSHLEAERLAVRLVQCRRCAHFLPDGINPRAGIGTCAVGAWPQSSSPPLLRPNAERSNLPQYCGAFSMLH